MSIHRSVRIAIQSTAFGFAAFASLACFIGEPSRDPAPSPPAVFDAGSDPVDVGFVPVDSGTVDSGPATGPACRGDLDCTQGVRSHCILDPGREGFCVQCAPAQGFTCPSGSACAGGVCVEEGQTPLTGPPCGSDAECTTGDRRRCVPDGTSSGNRVCAQCNPSLPCEPGSACANGLCVGQGALRFTLTWDRPGDVDLHVVTPAGAEIFYGARTQSGGTLDRDDTTGTGPENVFWAATPPAGTYLVCVVPFSISGPTSFRLSIAGSSSGAATPIVGTRTASTGNVACSRSSPTFVTEFRF